MPKNIKNLSDILPPELREIEGQSAKDYFGQPLIFYASRQLSGKNGLYKRIDVTLPDSEKHFIIGCGAAQVMAVLDWAEQNRAFPFIGQFVEAGQAILLKGTE